MNAKSCPFLTQEGKCSIYQTKRAFVCNLFPFNRSPFLAIGQDDAKFFGKCGRLAPILPHLQYEDKDLLIRQLYHSFGKSFLAAVQHDYVTEWANKVTIDLMKKKIIRPAMNYPYDLLKKRREHARKINFMEFLVECGYCTKEEMEATILRFENYDDGREKMEAYK